MKKLFLFFTLLATFVACSKSGEGTNSNNPNNKQIRVKVQDGWWIENQDQYIREDIQDVFGDYLVSIKREADWYTIILSEDYTKLDMIIWGVVECVIDEGITIIGDGAFKRGDLLERITLPKSLKLIGNDAFWGCEELAKITIPDNVTFIGREAFGNCANLRNVTIGSRVSEIGTAAFWQTSEDLTIYCKPHIPPMQREGFYPAENLKIYVPYESVDLYKSSWSQYSDVIEGANL